MTSKKTIIIGAGPSGLATAYYLKRAGVDFVMFEKGDRPGFSYASMHESLRLLTPACYSNLPGFKLSPKKLPYYTRPQLIDYYEDYAEHFELPIQFGQEVESVTTHSGGFEVKTKTDIYQAKSLVCATGQFTHPFIPPLKGLASTAITVMHSSAYQSPQALKSTLNGKQRVLVVGGGNTGTEIACELAEAGFKVGLSTKRPLHVLPHRIVGLDVHFIARPFEHLTRLVTRITGKPFEVKKTPVLGRQILQKIKSGQIHAYTQLLGFDHDQVQFKSESVPFDAVILATGYRYETPYLKFSSAPPGLFYVGKPGQSGLDSAFLRGINLDAKRAAKQVLRYLK